MNKNHPEKLQRAINSIILSQPFYTTLLLNQKIINDDSRKTFSVDGKTLRYNSKFLESLTHDETVGVLIHELSHLARFHHTRGKNKDHKMWNEATDFAINNLLIQEGFVLPKCALLGKFPIGECAENIYRILEKEENDKKAEENKKNEEKNKDNDKNDGDKNDDKQDGNSPNDKGDDSQSDNDKKDDNDKSDDSKSSEQDPNNKDSEGDNSNDNESDDAESNDDDSKFGDEDSDVSNSDKSSDKESDNSQSGNGNGSDSNEDDKSEYEPSFGEVEQTPEKDIESEETKTEVMVAQAISQAKQRGKLPAYLERLSNEVPARVDWREQLSKFVMDASNSDYTMGRPNKRLMGTGFILPSLYNKVFGKILMIRDTSGSIGQAEADVFLAETKSILDVFEQNGQEPKMTIIDCDCEIQQVVEYEGQNSIPLKGGGGTNFDKPFILTKESTDYDFSDVCCAIYLTDGCGDLSPSSEPLFSVLWCLICHNPSFAESVPFGEVVSLLEF